MSRTIYSRDWRDHAVPEPNTGCWLWDGQVDGRGYPKMIVANKHISMHRVIWAEANGAIPKGLVVCHRCDVPSCVNPDHLFIGAQVDNILDMVAKGRHGNANKTHCRRGHEYTTENTYLHKHDNTISRSCKQCILDSNARRRDRLKAEGAASNG